MKAYNTETKSVAKFIITFISAWDGESHENHYVTRQLREHIENVVLEMYQEEIKNG